MRKEKKVRPTTKCCIYCDKGFTHKWSLNRHIRTVHGQIPKNNNGRPAGLIKKYKCPICGNYLPNFVKFKDHSFESHQVDLQMHFFKFQSQSKFVAWKRKIEKDTMSWYVREYKRFKKYHIIHPTEKSQTCVTQTTAMMYYQCHRSGYFRPKKSMERRRRLKAQGSSKIDAYCPSRLAVKFRRNGTVKVIYCSTHMGHNCEASHLRLTDGERKCIAAKIAANIPFDVILDDLRNTAGSSLSRKHILTKHDLLNIQMRFLKKDDQSVKDLLGNNSKVDSHTGNAPITDLITAKADENEDFDDMEIVTFDPNVEDSDSSASEMSEDVNKQLTFDPNVEDSYYSASEMSEDVNKQLRRKQVKNGFNGIGYNVEKTPQQQINENIELKIERSFSLNEEIKNTTPGRPMELKMLSQMKSKLIEKFSMNVNNINSLRHINWVNNHIDRMFLSCVKSVKSEGTEQKGVTNTNPSEKTVLVFSNCTPTQHPGAKLSTNLNASKINIPLSSYTGNSVLESNVQDDLVLSQQDSQKRQKVPVSRPTQLNMENKDIYWNVENKDIFWKCKPKDYLKTPLNSSCFSATKQYLVPIVGKSNQYLIVQTKLNEPLPVPPLVQFTPKQKPNTNKNSAIDDHNYSLPVVPN